MIDLDEGLRPRWLFNRTVRESCNRGGFSEEGEFATEYGADYRCMVKLGCKGPVVKCNVPVRGWQSGIGGCPNVGGICMACTMPGYPDKFMPFMEADRMGALAARGARFTPAPVVRYLRKRVMERKYEVEPEWRRPTVGRVGAGGPPR
jgi:hydrogenase small subunit